MKITKEQLKQIIKEELAKELEEKDTYQLANPDRDLSGRGTGPYGTPTGMLALLKQHLKDVGKETGTAIAQEYDRYSDMGIPASSFHGGMTPEQLRVYINTLKLNRKGERDENGVEVRKAIATLKPSIQELFKIYNGTLNRYNVSQRDY